MSSNDRNAISRVPVYGKGGTISYTNTASNSASLPKGITGVWVTCSTNAWVRLAVVAGSTAPVALTSDFYCPAGQMVWIPDDSTTGEPLQLSVIRDASDGTAKFCPGV